MILLKQKMQVDEEVGGGVCAFNSGHFAFKRSTWWVSRYVAQTLGFKTNNWVGIHTWGWPVDVRPWKWVGTLRMSSTMRNKEAEDGTSVFKLPTEECCLATGSIGLSHAPLRLLTFNTHWKEFRWRSGLGSSVIWENWRNRPSDRYFQEKFCVNLDSCISSHTLKSTKTKTSVPYD